MLIAHLVPGYFVGTMTQSRWKPEWSHVQRILLWSVALGSSVAPDVDVMYNILFRGFFGHTTLWTHSLFVYGGIGLVWFLLHLSKRWTYLKMLIGFMVLGGLSHVVLDMIAHGTPIFYPISMKAFGIPPQRVVQGGVLAYVTDPIVLCEPFLLSVAMLHWTYHRKTSSRSKKILVITIIGGLLMVTLAFIGLLPSVQSIVLPMLPM